MSGRIETGIKISVALCTYNGARYLQEQLASIAQQTLLPDELVIVDDRSGIEDLTGEVVLEFARTVRFPVTFSVNETTLGSSKNFERAISKCQGEILFLADQDDCWHSEKIRTIMELFAVGEEVGLVFTDAEVTDSACRPLGHSLWGAVGFGARERHWFREGRYGRVLINRNVVTGATLAMRRRYWEEGIGPIGRGWMHDEWIALCMSAIADLVFLDQPMIRYRQHEHNQVGGRLPTRLALSWDKRSVDLDQVRKYGVFRQWVADLPATSRRDAILEEVDGKLRHLRARTGSGGVRRLKALFGELRKGGYGRYSAGRWRAFFRDLLIPDLRIIWK